MRSNNVVRTTLQGVGLLVLLVLLIWGVIVLRGNYSDYKKYDEFCEDRPNFCYCSFFNCEFKLQWDSLNGTSMETKQLCELATQLNDKEMIFKAGCE